MIRSPPQISGSVVIYLSRSLTYRSAARRAARLGLSAAMSASVSSRRFGRGPAHQPIDQMLPLRGTVVVRSGTCKIVDHQEQQGALGGAAAPWRYRRSEPAALP